MRVSLSTITALTLANTAAGFVSQPQNIEVVLSERFPGASISYKRANVCETTEGVNSYSGFVDLPKDLIPDAGDWPKGTSGKLFFWYFEARNDPANAPTSIYLGGGPGTTSLEQASVFPCTINADSNSTKVNPHSWNNNVNMLYVDQPFGAGFSHTTLANGTFHAVTMEFEPLDAESKEEPKPVDYPLMHATLDASSPEMVTNGTLSAARTFWRFAQVWFNEFPEWNTSEEGISIWATSYGGAYAPVFTNYILDQNALIEADESPLENATVLNMRTLGLLNAFIDAKEMLKGYIEFARNNTYNLPAISEEIYQQAMQNITDPEQGAHVLIDKCRAAVTEYDPESKGTVQGVNEICGLAVQFGFGVIQGVYEAHSPYDPFDITHNRPATIPDQYNVAFLNQPWVQAELGVPLNFTLTSLTVNNAFLAGTGDMARWDASKLGRLLDDGMNVALVYGDRDYRCNWFSGEDSSLAIPFDSAKGFAAAGYEPISLSDAKTPGLVRQHGNLSFTRVFQAGHATGGFQPQAVSAIFERSISRLDVATGESDISSDSDYSTEGPTNVRDIMNKLPPLIENICYMYSPQLSCTEEQLEAIEAGTAVIEDYVVVHPKGSKGKRLPRGDCKSKRSRRSVL